MEGNAFWEGLTWPPEKPTATTLSSLPAERNLGEMVEGEVILRERSIGRREVKEFSKKYLSLRVFKGQINQSSKGGSIESRHSIRRINSTKSSKKAEERAKVKTVKYIGKVSKNEEAFYCLSAKRKAVRQSRLFLRLGCRPPPRAPLTNGLQVCAFPLSTGHAGLFLLSEGARVFDISCHFRAPTL